MKISSLKKWQSSPERLDMSSITGFLEASHLSDNDVFWRGINGSSTADLIYVEWEVWLGMKRNGLTCSRMNRATFATSDRKQASDYGKLMVVIPSDRAIGCYSPVSSDMHIFLERWLRYQESSGYGKSTKIEELADDIRGDAGTLEVYLLNQHPLAKKMIRVNFVNDLKLIQFDCSDPVEMAKAMRSGHEVWFNGPVNIMDPETYSTLVRNTDR